MFGWEQCTPPAVRWDSKNWKEGLLGLVNVGIYLFSLSVPNKTFLQFYLAINFLWIRFWEAVNL